MLNQDAPPANANGVGSSDGLGGTTFRLYRYNPRRRARGVEAAEVEVTWPDGDKELLWMTQQDIRDNLKQFGDSQGLRDALEAYRLNAMPPNTVLSDAKPDSTNATLDASTK